MTEIIIKNGHVFDSVSGLKGEVADVCIKDGKIVESVGNGATVIDAAGKTVMAGVPLKMPMSQAMPKLCML